MAFGRDRRRDCDASKIAYSTDLSAATRCAGHFACLFDQRNHVNNSGVSHPEHGYVSRAPKPYGA